MISYLFSLAGLSQRLELNEIWLTQHKTSIHRRTKVCQDASSIKLRIWNLSVWQATEADLSRRSPAGTRPFSRCQANLTLLCLSSESLTCNPQDRSASVPTANKGTVKCHKSSWFQPSKSLIKNWRLGTPSLVLMMRMSLWLTTKILVKTKLTVKSVLEIRAMTS